MMQGKASQPLNCTKLLRIKNIHSVQEHIRIISHLIAQVVPQYIQQQTNIQVRLKVS